jgi:type I restriction enzyme M protein
MIFLTNKHDQLDLVPCGTHSETGYIAVIAKEALAGKHGAYEMVLTNPPFEKKSSVTIVNEAGDQEKQSLVVHRDDFWPSTSKCEPHRH